MVNDTALENLARALRVDSYELLLPPDESRCLPEPSPGLIRQLRQIKRQFDEALRAGTGWLGRAAPGAASWGLQIAGTRATMRARCILITIIWF
jgi:hypothetical protein